MNARFGALRSNVSVTEWRSYRVPCFVQSDIIHRPTVHTNRRNPFGCDFRAPYESTLQAFIDGANIPKQLPVLLHWAILETMNDLNLRNPAIPAKQRYPATLRTQVHRNKSFLVC